MKFTITVAILICWTALTKARDISFEFSHHYDDSVLRCQDNDLSINFSNSVISRIGPNFISSSLITCLDLRNNAIQEIMTYAFSQLPNLTDLYLSDNNLENCEYLFAFGGHQTLQVLTLDRARNRNYYYECVVSIFGDYPSLEILSIREIGITNLDYSKAIYSHSERSTPFHKLKILDLSDNAIRSTQFINLLSESLTHLYLQNNKLESLILSNMSSLVVLTLDGNNLRYVGRYSDSNPGLWLSGLKHLRYLSIPKNEIRTIESVVFQDNANLIYLNLSMNNINYLYPETFANLQSLETLDLSHNNLQNIPEVSREMNITILYLSCNQIKKVNGNVFARIPKLKELSLSVNQIDNIDVNAFSYLNHLEKLYLSGNNLTFLPKDWCVSFESLRYLNLEHNQFTSLESLSLMNTLPLMEVHLAMNSLEYLDAGSFDNLPRNVTVDLVRESPELTQCYYQNQRYRK